MKALTAQAIRPIRLISAILIAVSMFGIAALPARAASEIKIVVNKQAITTVDLSRRVAFLKLQRAKGNLQQTARDQLVNEALQMQEAKRTGLVVGDAQVNASFANFAQRNNLTVQKLNQILNQAGVTPGHFKEYIRAQMTWPRLVSARYSSSGQNSTQDMVAKMLEKGGTKPSTTEYILKQFIFVVPASSRNNGTLGARKREAEQLRQRFAGCDNAVQLVTGLKDVTVRDLGRILQPQLPPEWKPFIEKTSAGALTQPRVTERGIEAIAVCSSKTVSDDMAAAMVFEAEGDNGTSESDNAKKFLEELRSRAVIANR